MIHPVRIDKKHRYWIPGTDGKETQVPGFSEICNATGETKPNPFYTESGRDRGTALHEWLQFLVNNRVPAAPPDPRIADKVDGIKKFILYSGFKVVGVETPMYDPQTKVACTPDMWGYIGLFSWVIDMKSGSRQPYHALQTACQKINLAANGFVAQKRGALYLKKVGGYRLEEHMDESNAPRWKYIVHQYYQTKKEAA